MVGAGPGKSHTFQGGCDYFQCIYNDTQIFKTWAFIICIAFSPYSSMHHFTPVGSASRCYHFLKENNFDQIICILYNIPNHCSQNSHERLVMSPFLGEIQWLLPERNTKPDHQDWDMRHSCDNHIMSCEIRILMKLHCLLCRLECHPPEQAETFPD